MRIDPGYIASELQRLVGGSVDASRGQGTSRLAAAAAGEAAFESIDRVLLRRMRAAQVVGAAASTLSFADAHALAQRTAKLLYTQTDAARSASGDLDARRVRDLLSGD